MLLQLNEEQYLEVDPISPKTVTYDNVNEDTHNLSLNAMHGSNGVGTVRFTREVGSISVKILVDGGSFDNFIQPRVAKYLRLLVEPTPYF